MSVDYGTELRERSFVSGTEYTTHESVTVAGTKIAVGTPVRWRCPDTGEVFMGAVRNIFNIDGRDVPELSIDADVGRVPADEVEVL